MTHPDQPDPRIPVGNTQMTRQEVLDALEANIGFAKDCAANLLSYMGQASSPEQSHVVHEVQRVQGYLGGILLQLVRALRNDDQGLLRAKEPRDR